jgi:hypothetical protein
LKLQFCRLNTFSRPVEIEPVIKSAEARVAELYFENVRVGKKKSRRMEDSSTKAFDGQCPNGCEDGVRLILACEMTQTLSPHWLSQPPDLQEGNRLASHNPATFYNNIYHRFIKLRTVQVSMASPYLAHVCIIVQSCECQLTTTCRLIMSTYTVSQHSFCRRLDLMKAH